MTLDQADKLCEQIWADARQKLTPHDDLDVAYDGANFHVRCFDCDAVWQVTNTTPGQFAYQQTQGGDGSDLITTPPL